jgi:hypothetical protein
MMTINDIFEKLPRADIVKETKDYFYVHCPHCGEIHKHGAALGPRVPHCWGTHPGRPHYVITRPDRSRRA